MRILDRVAHAGLRGEVHHALEPLAPSKSACIADAVGDVELREAEIGVALEHREARRFELGIVVAVEVVEADHLVAALEQRLARCEIR